MEIETRDYGIRSKVRHGAGKGGWQNAWHGGVWRKVRVPLISIAVLVGVWTIAAMLTNDAQVLPSLVLVLETIVHEARSGELFFHVGVTLLRVLSAFVLAMLAGICLGLVMGTRKQVDRWLDPWIVFFLNIPALVLIVLCYLWIGLNELAAILAVTLSKLPMVTVIVREGARAFSPDLFALARVYRLDRRTLLRHVLLPQLAPQLAAAARAGVAVIWKIVLVVEFLGRPNGVGFQIHTYFQLFDVAYVLAYAITFVAVIFLIETLFLQPLEKSTSQWRQLRSP